MEPLAEAAGWFFGWLLRNSVYAAALVGLVLVLERTVFRRLPPRWRYALWLLVVARLLLPLAPASSFNVLNLLDLGPEGLRGLPGPLGPHLEESWLVESQIYHPLADTPGWFVWAIAIWLAGAAGLGALLAIDHRALQRAVGSRQPLRDPRILDLLAQSKAVMAVRRRVAVVETAAIGSPALCGWSRPRLLLPVGLLSRLNTDETRFLFLHELAHVKRGDIAFNWLVAAVQILHWFNPFVWIALRRLLAVREEVCDALVLSRCFDGAAREYGLTLLRLLEECAPRRLLPALAGVLDDARALRERIRTIARFKSRPEASFTPALLVVGVALSGLTDMHGPDTTARGPAPSTRETATNRARSHPPQAAPADAGAVERLVATAEAEARRTARPALDLLAAVLQLAADHVRVPSPFSGSGVSPSGGVAPRTERAPARLKGPLAPRTGATNVVTVTRASGNRSRRSTPPRSVLGRAVELPPVGARGNVIGTLESGRSILSRPDSARPEPGSGLGRSLTPVRPAVAVPGRSATNQSMQATLRAARHPAAD